MENKKKSNLSVEKQTYGQKGKQTEVQRHHNTNENCKNCNLAKNRVHFFKATFDTPMVFVVVLDTSETREEMRWVMKAMERSLFYFFSSLGMQTYFAFFKA